MMHVDMRVCSLTVDPFTNMPIVILKDPDGRQSLPIWVGIVEASAIATELEGIKLDRPTTHDLIRTLLTVAGLSVDRIEVHDLQEGTFYATIQIRQQNGECIALDARPSDAIALALRTGAPIRVAQTVIDKVHHDDPAPELATSGACGGLARMAGDSDFELAEGFDGRAYGKWKM